MARDAITLTQVANTGTTPIAQVTGVAANDLKVTPSAEDDLIWVEVENIGSASADVVVETPITVDGIAVSDVTVTVPAPTQASLETALGGANDDLVFTAVQRGKGGNGISVQYVVAGTSTPLTITVTGLAIVVNVATDGAGAATSTASQVKTALEGDSGAAALISVALAAGNDGSGVVSAMAATNLAGGAVSVRLVKLVKLTSFLQNDGSVYLDIAADNTLAFRAYRI